MHFTGSPTTIDLIFATYFLRIAGNSAERGVAKTAFCELKRHIPHFSRWGILHFTLHKGDFATPYSGRETPDGG